MFRGRPPFRGYPPPVRPYPSQGYRDDRARPRPPYHQDYPEYRDHGASEAYHRRHPSPGPGGHRGGDFWTGGAPPERSPSHRGPAHLDHNLVISVGNELTGPPSHHDRDYLPRPEYERSGSRGRSPGRSRGRSKSRHRGESRSPDRSRGRSKSRHRGESRSPDRSRGRSKSRAKSRGRSKSRARSKSRSSSRSRGKSRGRSRSLSSSSSSSSSSIRDKNDPSRKRFKELELARRRREVEELLGQPTKSILKKHNSYEDSPSLRRSDSPRDLDRTMARVADQLMQAVKLNDPRAVAAVLSELRSDPQMSQRANLNNEIKEILNLLGVAEPVGGVSQRVLDDIDDEEKFLYGELEEPKMSAAPEPDRHHSLDLYGDVTEDSLYSDLPSQRAMAGQVYSCPPTISPHLQVTPSVSEPNRHMSQPSISPNQNVMAYPPGTEPLEESERQALEEYEKIQDLLKTIGLDLGVGEISKMAARTKERLHGNKQPPKTPTRRRYSSGSSNGSCHSRVRRRRSQSGSSSSSRSRSRSHGRGTKRGASWSSEDHESKKTTAAKTSKDWEVKETKNEWSTPMLPQSQTSDTAPIPTHTGMPIPTYPPPQLPGMMPPNYPPSAYSQYGNYLPYIHQQWPPMYPPPNMTLPPQPATENLTPPPTYKKAYRKPTPETGALGFARSVGQEEQRRRSQDQSISDEQNNESEKLKVLEEREKLRQEREVRMTKKEYLIKELERLRKQQGELLRKKRREKDGHKDPLLQEINRLQDEVMAKISNLRKEHEAAERKRTEIEKVAQILGLSPLDRPGKTSKLPKIRDQEELPPKSEKREQGRNPEEQPAAGSTALKATPATSTKASPERLLFTAEAPPPDPFEYYDAGNHWCKNCNITSGSMFDFFTHLHSKPHRKTLDPYDRPWASSPTKTPKTTAGDAKRTKPAKGSEFLVPVRGFFCLLCKEFYGDAICAEEHVITHSHNEKYKKQMVENPLYEQRRNLDRQAGLGLEAGGKKRKYDDDDKDRDDKNKNKKDKKKEEEAAETCDEKIKVKKEEEEQKVKAVRKSLEEDKFYSKKDEDEKYKQSKKEEKHNSRENEDRNSRYRGSSRDEEYRHRHRRDDDGHPKYGNKCTEDKYKEEKCSDSRSKHDRERDEGKHKAEPEKPGGKPDARKSEPPPKPYELPKIFCGPSPAMRAKLRKQAMEASKAPASAASATSFGKFTWKKKENQLAKEAQKVAAEFLKDEEAAAKEKPGEEEDSFSKSVAAAKEIAEKLAGEELKSPPWYTSGRGQIRPNLRAPVAPLRRASLAGKPASLNTFLNMRPQSTDGGPPGPFPRAPFRPPNPQMFNNKPGPPVSSAGPLGVMSAAPTVTRPEQFGPKLPPSMLKPGPCQNTSKPDSAESKPEMKQGPLFPKPAPVQSKPATGQSSPSTTSPAPLNTASSETRSAPSEVKAATPPAPAAPLTPSKATPSQPALIKIVSDVAAPGVPESEQTRTVFVKPPPFKSMLAGPQKSEKLQGNLAAAKAQALFDIFYSSLGQAGPSSFSRTETDVGAGKGSPSAPVQNKNQPQNKPEPQIQSQDQTQTPNILPTQTHNQSEPPDEPRPQTQEMPESQPQVEPQLQNEPKALKLTQPQPQQTQQKPESQPPDHQKEPSHEPQTAPQHHSLSPTSTEPPNTIPTSPQNGFQSPQTQADGDIQITSVWSLQDITAPTDKAAGPEPSDPPPHSEQTPSAPTEGLSQSPPTSPGRKSQICPQTKPISMEPAAEPLFQPETQFEPQIDQDANSHQETTPEPQPKPKPSPRTRGKAAAMKKTPSAAPVRQTRSQTRYQTRQQQSQPEPEQNPGAGNQDLTASEAKGLESPDPEQEAASHRETDPPGTDVTTETLGLPSDMTALDFDYTFNFE
ncbi:zinc finger protein 318 isoform X2 [Poecilia latipinna]|uniref:zinc finger protein 318 isoform X2 n=1 Tax=Poecilia latipinna TaxID=48699 RepID=UPI00072EE50F|nr:PREDICTED: zinc finger protein 318 isoform X2 [Poecilia latipinna]